MKRSSFPIPRSPRRTSANAKHKARCRNSGLLRCMVCGFYDARYPPYGLLEWHHVRRRADGGGDDFGNGLLLCPTHHSAADILSRRDLNLTKPRLLALLAGSYCKPPENSVFSAYSMESAMPDEVSESLDLSSHVADVKATLLRIPLTAYEIARRMSGKPGNRTVAEEVYHRVAEELAADGYAPDSCGQPGPAVKAHYESGVLGG